MLCENDSKHTGNTDQEAYIIYIICTSQRELNQTV